MENKILLEKKFLDDCIFIKKIGEGTYGIINLFKTPLGELIIKETKHSRGVGYQVDFLTEIDTIIKFKYIKSIISLKGIIFDDNSQKGYILLEHMKCNLFYLSQNLQFRNRINKIKDIIRSIGGLLAIMHKNSFIHNDIKSNNILFKDDMFKLADFGKSKHVINKNEPYSSVDKYRLPYHVDVFISEYWAFVVVLIEFILGGKTIIIGDKNTFFEKYKCNGIFDIKSLLNDRLSYAEYRLIPSVFWNFVNDIDKNKNMTILLGLKSCNYNISEKCIKQTNDNILKICNTEYQYSDIIKNIYYNTMTTLEFYKFNNLLNKLLSLSDIQEDDIKYYAEIVYIIVMKSKVKNMINFTDTKMLLSYEKAFLIKMNFQTVLV